MTSNDTIYISGLVANLEDATRLTSTVKSVLDVHADIEVVPIAYGDSPEIVRIMHPAFVHRGSWDQFDESTQRRYIERRLNDHSWWVSQYGPETDIWPGGLPTRIVGPNPDPVSGSTRAAQLAAQRVGYATVPHLDATEPLLVHDFGREWGWQLEITTPGGGVVSVHNRRGAELALSELRAQSSNRGVGIRPTKSSWLGHMSVTKRRRISLVALGARVVHSVSINEESEFEPLPGQLLSDLGDIVREVHWAGAAYMEYAEVDGNPTILRWDQGFPVWVAAAAQAGHNGPAALVTALRDETYRSTTAQTPHDDALSDANQNCAGQCPISTRTPALSAEAFLGDMRRVQMDTSSPSFLYLPVTTKRLWDRAETALQHTHDRPGPVTKIAISIKTNPSITLLRNALSRGFAAEAISAAEADWAISNGFQPSDITMNGPGKRWPSPLDLDRPYAAIFADSLTELSQLLDRRLQCNVVGVRLRAPGTSSRFGVPVDDCLAMDKLIQLLNRAPSSFCGLSFHYNSHWLGFKRWYRAVDSVLATAALIEERTSCAVRILDLGGGWFPDDWYSRFLPNLPSLEAKIGSLLPNVETLYLEPGKALAQPTHAFTARVLGIRRSETEVTRQIVVDGSVAELQAALAYPRHIATKRPNQQDWSIIGPGNGQILGRLCMEDDVLAENCAIPRHIAVGDYIAFSGAGAYDMSMSYPFALGGDPRLRLATSIQGLTSAEGARHGL